MEIRLEMNNWVINDEYFITEGVYEYEVYSCRTEEEEEEEEAKLQYSNESFEACLTWIWNSL